MKILFFSLGFNILCLFLATLFIARKGGISYLQLKLSKLKKNAIAFVFKLPIRSITCKELLNSNLHQYPIQILCFGR
ncbi:hypothetical protein [Chroococcidiopsis sp. SAG 2025]|uniref:hypothetical protein n=1 Tax=Chroococcidiopsis sp. SAG 2025 TaxID=171389 RepID=UPI0029370221|nr:hypothetical protein [Chroococcidiopsis sp. SAG 2025]